MKMTDAVIRRYRLVQHNDNHPDRLPIPDRWMTQQERDALQTFCTVGDVWEVKESAGVRWDVCDLIKAICSFHWSARLENFAETIGIPYDPQGVGNAYLEGLFQRFGEVARVLSLFDPETLEKVALAYLKQVEAEAYDVEPSTPSPPRIQPNQAVPLSESTTGRSTHKSPE
jgi:hypothetical protein